MTAPRHAGIRLAALYGGPCLVLFALIAKASGNIADLDLWHQLALAREALQSGRLPLRDSFAYTPTLPVIVHHEWGAGVLGLAILRLLGTSGLMLWNFLLGAGALSLALSIARRRGASVRILILCGLLAAPLVAGGYQPVRAQAYGFLLFCAALYCAEREREGRHLWLLVWLALFPLWINLHASCVLAWAVFGLTWIERRSWRVAALLVGMVAVLYLLNPYGAAYVSYLIRSAPKARPLIEEWHPAWTSRILPLVLAAWAVLLYALAARWPRREWPAAGLLLLFGIQSMLHLKLAPFFALAWLAFVPAWIEKTRLARIARDVAGEYEMILRPAWAILVLSCVVFLIATRPWSLRVPDRDARPSYPVGPVRFLKSAGFHGRVLAHFEHGAYISWELAPAVKVAIDSRYEVAYPDDVVADAIQVYSLGEWRAFTRKYPTDLILTQPRYTKLEAGLAAADWKRVYTDGEYSLWETPRGLRN